MLHYKMIFFLKQGNSSQNDPSSDNTEKPKESLHCTFILETCFFQHKKTQWMDIFLWITSSEGQTTAGIISKPNMSLRRHIERGFASLFGLSITCADARIKAVGESGRGNDIITQRQGVSEDAVCPAKSRSPANHPQSGKFMLLLVWLFDSPTSSPPCLPVEFCLFPRFTEYHYLLLSVCHRWENVFLTSTKLSQDDRIWI